MDSPMALLSIAQVCEHTGLSRTLIYEELSSGRLRSLKVGRRRLVPTTALGSWIEDRLADVAGGGLS